MPKWIATVRRNRGYRSIKLSARSAEEATEAARRHGEVESVSRAPSSFTVLRLSRYERGIFFVRVGTMLRSRVSQSDAMREMATNYRGNIKRAAALAFDNIQTGKTLVEALEMDTVNFPASIVAMLRASAMNGDMPSALGEVATFEEEMAKVTRGSMAFLWKALMGFVLSLAMIIASTYWMAPKVLDNPIIRARHYDFDWLIKLGVASLFVLGAFLALVVVIALASTLGRAVAPVQADRLIGLVPFYKDLVTAKVNHIALFRMSVLMGTPMMYEQVLQSCAEDTRPGVMRRDLERAIVALKDGKPWARELSALHSTDRISLSMSTDRKETSRSLRSLSEQYSELYRRRVEFVGPALATIGAVWVTYSGGLMFAQTMIPMMQLLTDVSGKR